MTQALNLANFANNLNTSGATSNAGLQNSAVTVTAGTAMSGGGSVSLGGSVTLNNAGVTSLVAGTGISISGSTGAVTVTSTVSGGVSSVNGQTGAVVLTDAGSIGSIGVFMNSGNSDLAYSSTIAGSTLRFNENTNSGGSAGQAPFYNYFQINNANYGGGGSGLSGTWRKLNSGSIFTTQTACGDTTRNYMRALYIRVS